MTRQPNRPAGTQPTPKTHPLTVFRLLHAKADTLIADRAEALRRLSHLPGAKLFIVHAESPISIP